jgi:uncharacterized membrane protein
MPDPLHPMVVHFPIVLAGLLPISALWAWWAIRRGARPTTVWVVPVALAGALTLSAFVALRTGEAQEDRVEHIVGESVLHAHEEAGERFLVLACTLTLVALVGLAGGALGSAGRLVSTVGAFALVVVGLQVGASGGELVYRYGAASAYVQPASSLPTVASPEDRRRDEPDQDDH